MPEISRFLGMIIYMYYDDHAPPHFHVIYGDREAVLSIKDGQLLRGHLPPKALALVQEWTEIHRDELSSDWTRAESHLPLTRIAPLE